MKRKATGIESTVIHKDIVYERWNDDNGAEFFFPVSKIQQEEPIVRWRGGKIPWQSWVDICAYCEKTTEEETSECQLQLFYSDTDKKFMPWAFPQKKKSGMVTKELNEHPNFIKQLHAIREKGYYPFGTLHTHVKAAAFQSSTDHSDEKESEGIHITLGKISTTDEYDIHSRFTAKKPGYEDEEMKELVAPSYFMLPVEWIDFIEPPDSIIADRLPSFLRKKILQTMFLRPDVSTADQDLIKVWMDNRIEEKVEPPKTYTTNYGQHDSHAQHPWRRRGNWSNPPKNWLSQGNQTEKSPFPDFVPGANHSAIDYTSAGPIMDPDVNEEYFRHMQGSSIMDQQTEFFTEGRTNKASTLELEIMKDDLIAFCDIHELTTDTLLDLLIDGSKLPENAELLKYLNEELEELMEELESQYNVKVGYIEVIDMLEELQMERQQKGESIKQGKTKNAITKRKKLKHSLHAK